MKLTFIYPWLPPAPKAIGEHTALLAAAVAEADAEVQVRVLCAEAGWDPVPGVAVAKGFSVTTRAGVRELAAAIAADPPDWLVLQHNPFSYGNRGFSPHLAPTIRSIRAAHPEMRFGLLVHEAAAAWVDWRHMVMSTWQMVLLWQLARQCDVFFGCIDRWVRGMHRWFPATPAHHLPVGANIPYLGMPRAEARARLGLDAEAFVLGVFGTAHPTRLLPYVRQAADALRQETDRLTVLYIGPDGAAVRAAMGEGAVIDAGRLPAEEVSRHLAAVDVYLAPFKSGVSMRRGSFLAGIQHGLASVSTRGPHTDAPLRAADGEAVLLSNEHDPEAFVAHVRALYHDEARRARIASAARTFYRRHCDWDVLAHQLLTHLRAAEASPVASR